jgi:hypothetical protein
MATILKKARSIGVKKKHKNKASKPTSNLKQDSSTELKPLNFKIGIEDHREIKSFATERGLTMISLLKLMFAEYKDNHS